MDIRGKHRAFVPVSRTGRAEQAPKLGQDSGIERATGTPKARYTSEVNSDNLSPLTFGRKSNKTRLPDATAGSFHHLPPRRKNSSAPSYVHKIIRGKLSALLVGKWLQLAGLLKVGKLAAKKLEPITYHLKPLGRFISRLWRTKTVIRIRRTVAALASSVFRVLTSAAKRLARFIMSWPVWLRRGVSAALVISLITGGYLYIHNQQYKLSAGEQKLLALPSVDLKMVKETKDGFTYNHAAEQKVDGHSITAAAAPADSTGKFPYEVTLPHNESAGIKFSDSSGDLSFTLKPNFSSAAGREDNGRVIYPEGLNSVHAYTFKRNGVKEDIILSKAPSTDTYTKSWTLNLGDKLEAKMMSNGGVGIYSADQTLFGNVQASDAKDQALLDKARKNGQKTNLAFVIPAPFVTDGTGQKNYQNIKFGLKGNVLTLTVRDMKSRSYPLSIDPTLVVTTTADFLAGTDDDSMIDYTTSGQIGRSDISYGAASSMVQQTSAFANARSSFSSVVYKGYIYIIGGQVSGSPSGCSAGYCNDIQYCPINTDGSVGACTQQTNAFTTARVEHTSVVYNGYVYIIGGYDGTNRLNDIQYCPLNSNGSVGTCTQQTNAFTSARYGLTSAVYNGYLYIIGGTAGTNVAGCSNFSGFCNDIQYCLLSANGSVGTCTQQTNAFTNGRYFHSSVISNGYLYIIGGTISTGSSNDIQYCPLNADGSAGICTQQTNAFTTQRYGQASVAYDGYLYIIGGYTGSYANDIQYCPLNSNGSVGTCSQQTSAFTNGRSALGGVVYNGYLYIVGGVGNVGTGCSAGLCNDIQYGLLGKLGSSQASIQQTNAFTTGRYTFASVVYNGYLYIIGGSNGSFLNDIQYCGISSSGSVGTCTQQTNAFTTARAYHDAVAYNGYLYILGGYGGASNPGCDSSGNCNDIQYCPINSSGPVGACTQQLNAFTGPRQRPKAVAYNGYLYISGGNANGTYQNDIQYCPFNSNGSVGTCTQQTSAFANPRSGHTSVVYNGYLYIIGGGLQSGTATGCATGNCNDIIHCPINSNGSVGTCTQQTSAFTTERNSFTSVVSNGYLYIIGGIGASNATGCDSSGKCSDIQFCPINSNGSVGTCTQELNAFIGARYDMTSVTLNGYLYIIGGSTTGAQNDIQHIPLSGGMLGSVGTTTHQTSVFTSARYRLSTVVYNGYLYIVGGYDGSTLYNDIQYCPLNSNGSVGTCTQQTNAFTSGRYWHATAAYNGYLYIVGGQAANSATGCDASGFCNDIQYCPLNSNGSVGTCTQQTSAFTGTRYGLTSVANNGYLYVIGGWNGSAYQNDIQYCPLNSNGSVGTCTQQTSAFTSGRVFFASVVYNGYLYIMGGEANSGATGCGSGRCSDIQYCPLNSNGSVGTCTQQLAAIMWARENFSAAVSDGYIYIAGGLADTIGGEADVQYCRINSDGSTAVCSEQYNILSDTRRNQGSIAYNGYFYVIGGNYTFNGTLANDVEYFKIGSRGFGGVGSATQQTNAFTSQRTAFNSVVYNGYLYIIGGAAAANAAGCDSAGRCNDIQHCPINVDGSVGACTQQTGIFTTPRSNFGSVVYNGNLYIVGGRAANSAFGCNVNGYCNDILYCPLNTDGSVASCNQQTNAFTSPRSYLSTVAYNGYLYILGGDASGAQNDIQYCPINSNGSTGACTQQTSAFSTPREGQSAVVYNGYLYIIGGWPAVAGKLLNDIQYCPLNGNGSVGTCTQKDDAFTNPRYYHTSVVYDGYIYITGGSNGSSYFNDIQYCPLNSNGSVDGCLQTSSTFSTGRQGLGSVAYNGYLYRVGGFGSTGTSCSTITQYCNDIQYVKISGPQWKASYERILDVGISSTNVASISYNGSAQCVSTINYKTAGTNGIFGAITTIPATKPATSYSINQSNVRYMWVSVAMDDSTCSTNSNITDVTLTYSTNPAAPTLSSPSSGAGSVSLTPTFQMRTTDPNSDYLRYKINVCSNSSCSGIVRTIDQTASQTGWSGQDTQTSTAYIGSSTITSSTMANYTYQTPALSPGTQYWWRAYAIDPAGDNVWSSASSIQSFTTSYIPAAPTLITPAAAATGVSSTASFQLRTTDADNDYLQYKFQLCSDSACNTVVQTLDEPSSQTGWFGQDVQGNTAYTGNATLANSTIATYSFQSPSLKANTQYWWRAYAIDPGGSNTFSSASSIGTFTTAQNETFFKGGFNLNGGVRFGP